MVSSDLVGVTTLRMTPRPCLGVCPSTTPDRVNGGIRWIFSWDVGFAMIPNRWLSVTRHVGQSSSRIGGSENLPRPRLKEYAEVGHNFAPAAAEMGRSTDADSDGNVRKPFRKNLVPDA